MIEVKYKNTEEQWIDFSIYKTNNSEVHQKSVKIRKRIVVFLGLFIGVLYCILGMQEYNQGNSPIFSIIFALIFITLGITSPCYLPKFWLNKAKKNLKERLKNDEGILGKNITITLNKEEMNITKKKHKNSVPLSLITDFTTIDDCLCISFEGNEEVIIPYDAFKSDEDKKIFEDTIKKYLFKK
ncbi:hypothetical protein [Clostridium uliginosum]|uniref:YcxB-like protein n=1 Tax=Clostridium uliginosum TaxID=119641 RepID=A0A1I1MUL9_9CLOT|nr:hypothetical protein [Clostridium uliginosum]SFC85280.1 hypothetical protein SAMN05421842_11122 [Clostridium uliginosum]